jgi:Uma2 family endonuclease
MSAILRDTLPVELLDGVITSMSPRPSANHNIVSSNIYRIFSNFLRKNTCSAYADGMEVHLDEKNYVIPDMSIVCNPGIVKQDGIHGAPNLIVEVLSPSSFKRDRGYKMELYARSGIEEYWIVSPVEKTIEVYLLKGGLYQLENVYSQLPEYELRRLTESERSEVPSSFKTSLFPELNIEIDEIFEKMI